MGRRTTRHRAQRVLAGGDARREVTTLAVEEPLEIRVAELPERGVAAGSAPLRPPSTTVTTTMRLHGDDFDLALGHLVAEGLVADGEAVATMMHCTDTGPDGSPTFNVVEVTLADGQVTGRVLATTADGVDLHVKGTKRSAPHTQHIPFAEISKGVAQVEFTRPDSTPAAGETED